MSYQRVSSSRALLLAVGLLAGGASAGLEGQATDSSVSKQLDKLPQIPEPQRPAAILKAATDLRTLPPGQVKVRMADTLIHLANQGDLGREALQAVADTLARALKESPQPGKGDKPAMPYVDLARFALYDQITTDLQDPSLAKAIEILKANDADAAKADFTLEDNKGKKLTFSSLRGKIVVVNFWETTCQSCPREMADLDLIDAHYQSQGLEILSVTDEPGFNVTMYLNKHDGVYHPTVLFDPGNKVAKQFHVDALPRTFVFDRDGKLVAESVNVRGQRQLFEMLAKAGLHPLGSAGDR
jgi:peroxiredoxin